MKKLDINQEILGGIIAQIEKQTVSQLLKQTTEAAVVWAGQIYNSYVKYQ